MRASVRPAHAHEAGTVADLVLQSDCGMLTALFGPAVKQLLEHLHCRPGNPYRSSNTLVIAEQAEDGNADGAVIGAMVGSLVAGSSSGSARTAGLLFGWYGPGVIARFPRLARAGRALRDLDRDDFYLSHIAILPGHRGRGAGGQLLRAVEEHARNQGARRVVLDVEENNDRARAFHERMGYAQISVVRIDLRRHGVFSFHRLGKGL